MLLGIRDIRSSSSLRDVQVCFPMGYNAGGLTNFINYEEVIVWFPSGGKSALWILLKLTLAYASLLLAVAPLVLALVNPMSQM